MTQLTTPTVFVWPVPRYKDGRAPKISSGYRSSDRPNHNGSDIMYPRKPEDGGTYDTNQFPTYSRRHFMPAGVPALAYGPGKVVTSEQANKGGYVVIDHPLGWRSQYMHLARRDVRVGQWVNAGQRIGIIGDDPTVSDPRHLHFQIRYEGNLVDPATYLKNATMLDWPSDTKLLYVGIAAALVGGYWWYSRRRR